MMQYMYSYYTNSTKTNVISVCLCEAFTRLQSAIRTGNITQHRPNCSLGSGFKKCLSLFGPFDFAPNDWRLWARQLGRMSSDGMWKRELGKLAHVFCIPSCSDWVLSHICNLMIGCPADTDSMWVLAL